MWSQRWGRKEDGRAVGEVVSSSPWSISMKIERGQFGGKKSAIEIDSSIWREEIGNRNRLVNLAGRNRQ